MTRPSRCQALGTRTAEDLPGCQSQKTPSDSIRMSIMIKALVVARTLLLLLIMLFTSRTTIGIQFRLIMITITTTSRPPSCQCASASSTSLLSSSSPSPQSCYHMLISIANIITCTIFKMSIIMNDVSRSIIWFTVKKTA